MTVSRRSAARNLLLSAFSGSGALAFAQEPARARDLVARVQDDLQRAAEFSRFKEKERVRYQNAQHHLSEFDRELTKGHFDQSKLDDAIDDVKNVLKNDTLGSRDRDALTRDLADLRTLRELR